MITLTNINKFYKSGSENYHALKNVNLTFNNTGMTFILGKSGSGKSTLLNIIGGIDSYDSGNLEIDGVSTTKFSHKDYNIYRNTYVGFVFQEFNVLKGLSVWENIALSLELQHQNQKKSAPEIQKIIDLVGLTGLEKRMMNQISGGQRQRVAIARALIKKPRMIIADEPTGNLDNKNSEMIMNLLKELSKEHLIIIVTHNDKLANTYADRIIGIRDGQTYSVKDQATIAENSVEKTEPVKIPLKTSLSLGTKSMLKNKFRFIIMILLFAISLTFAGVVINLSLVDTAMVYSQYQEDYDNFAINLNKKYSARGVSSISAFYSYELKNITNTYTSSTGFLETIKGMDYYIPINRTSMSKDTYYSDTIQRVHVYSDTIRKYPTLHGSTNNPTGIYTCVISDYLAEALLHYEYFEGITKMDDLIGKMISHSTFANKIKIVGIFQSGHHSTKARIEANPNDSKITAALEDNLLFYSSLFVSSDPDRILTYEKLYSLENMSGFYDDCIFDGLNLTGFAENVRYTTYDEALAQGLTHATSGKEPLRPKEGEASKIAVSTGFFEKVFGIKLKEEDYLGDSDTRLSINDAYFKKVSYMRPILQADGTYAERSVYAQVYLSGVSRIPIPISVEIVDVLENSDPVVYLPSDQYLLNLLLSGSFGQGGFLTILNTAAMSDQTDSKSLEANAKIFSQMMKDNLVITNKTFQKVLLVEDYIANNLLLFLAIFFIFSLFSVLLIFNFVIVNIKNSTRDIGIYMSLGMSGWRIALIYLFQVVVLGVISWIIASIGMSVFLLLIDATFTSQAAVNLAVIKISVIGIISILGIAIIVPTVAIILPLFDLSRKHPIDVIKSA